MAMTACKECGEKISTKAEACPKCGAVTPRGKPGMGCGALLLTFGAIAIVLSMVGTAIDSYNDYIDRANMTPAQRVQHEARALLDQQRENERRVRSDAVYTCRTFIERQLKDADSAKWVSDLNDTPLRVHEDNLYIARLGVRAKNSFGAYVLDFFDCRLRKEPSSWVLVSLTQLET